MAAGSITKTLTNGVNSIVARYWSSDTSNSDAPVSAINAGIGTPTDAAAAADGTGELTLVGASRRDLLSAKAALDAVAATTTWQQAVALTLTGIKNGLGTVVLAAGSAVIGKVGLQINAADVSATNPVFTQAVSPSALTLSDKSSAISSGNTASIASNANRKSLTIQNNNATGDIRVNEFGTATSTNGLVLKPGQGYDWPAREVPVGQISIWGGTTGLTFFAREGV